MIVEKSTKGISPFSYRENVLVISSIKASGAEGGALSIYFFYIINNTGVTKDTTKRDQDYQQ